MSQRGFGKKKQQPCSPQEQSVGPKYAQSQHSSRSQSEQMARQKLHPEMPQSLHHRPKNPPSQGKDSAYGSTHGGREPRSHGQKHGDRKHRQRSQGDNHSYRSSQNGTPSTGRPYAPSNGTEYSNKRTSDWVEDASYHHSGGMFPQAPASSAGDDCSDSGISELSERTIIGPGTKSHVSRSHRSTKHSRGAPSERGSLRGSERSDALLSHHGFDDGSSEAGSESNSTMSDSGYYSRFDEDDLSRRDAEMYWLGYDYAKAECQNKCPMCRMPVPVDSSEDKKRAGRRYEDVAYALNIRSIGCDRT